MKKKRPLETLKLSFETKFLGDCCVWTIILLYTCITTINHSLCIDSIGVLRGGPRGPWPPPPKIG